MGKLLLICPIPKHSMQWSQQSSSTPGVVSSTEDGQAPRGTPEGGEHTTIQLLQLQRATASRPVSTSHAQQADRRVEQQQPAERWWEQACHVLRKCSAGSAKAQTSS